VDRDQLSDWLERYEGAWRTPGTDALKGLFTPEASYSTGPYEEPHRGLEAIGAMWKAERNGPDEDFTMASEVLAVEGDTGVARVEVRYGRPKEQEYRDLWIVHLDDEGLCFHFEEWPFWPPGSGGQVAGGGSG
jgi:SnoaL-like domain